MRFTMCFLALLAACSGGDAVTGTTTAVSSGGECAEFAEALCGRVDACSPALVRYGTGRGRGFGSLQACVRRFEEACEGWLAAPGAQLGASDVGFCKDELAGGSCCKAVAAYDRPVVLSCLDVPGTGAHGAPCAAASQCQGVRCDGAGAGCGKCSVSTLGQLAGDGATCGTTIACGYWLDCKSGECTCAPDTSTCLPGTSGCTIALAGADEACGLLDTAGAEAYCQTGLECVEKNDLGRGYCKPYAADGGACSPYEGPPCLYPATCIDGTCTRPGAGVCPG